MKNLTALFVLLLSVCLNNLCTRSLAARPDTVVTVVSSPNWTSPEREAAEDLTLYLSRLYPKTKFVISQPSGTLPATARIFLGCKRSLPDQAKGSDESKLSGPESYAVTHRRIDGDPGGIILGEDPAGVVYDFFPISI